MVPASFDRSWDAALGAAADSGIQVASAGPCERPDHRHQGRRRR
jgi:hypothetical protein